MSTGRLILVVAVVLALGTLLVLASNRFAPKAPPPMWPGNGARP